MYKKRIDPDFCELYPNDPKCNQDFCELYPNDPKCTEPRFL